MPTHPRKAVAEAAHFDYVTVKNSQQGAEVKTLVGAGPRGATFARAVHRNVMDTFQCDQEECLREVVHSTPGRLGLPTGLKANEQSRANGRAEQRVRALRERLQIMVEDARRCGVEIILDRPVAQLALTHAEWIQNFLVKSDVDLSDGGTKNHTT